MPSKMSAEERKALLRQRLRQYGTEPKAPLGTPYKREAPTATAPTVAAAPQQETPKPQEPLEDSEPEKTETSEPSRRPSSRDIGRRMLEQRRNKPANYKVHVVTALALAITVNTLALGWKAVVGKV